MYILSKILPLLVLPLGVSLILLVAGVILRRRWMLIAAIMLLWLASSPIVARPIFHTTEGGLVRIPPEDVEPADAIVVLSGGRVTAPGPAAVSEWNDADRFFAGIELFKAAKAPLLIFTGGWSPLRPDAPLEGAVLAAYAMKLGVPATQILTSGRAANTAEEAAAVSVLLRSLGKPVPRILLVTSAFHMSRSQLLFGRAGFSVIPYPVDFAWRGDGFSWLDIFPNANALATTQSGLREWYGRIYYRIRS